MKIKIAFTIVLFFLTILLLPACEVATPTEADCPAIEVVCVGLVTNLSGIKDRAFNQSAWEGILNAQAEKYVDYARYIETIDTKDYEGNIASFTAAGFDVIIAVGDQFSDVTYHAAENYPQVNFIGVDQAYQSILHNLVDIVFNEDQTGFLAGALAALLTKTNTVSVILDSNSSFPMEAIEGGFEAGVRYVDSGIKILPAYPPAGVDQSFSDAKWGASAAAQAIQDGADVVFAAGLNTGYGALVGTASTPGIYCIGIANDQWENVPSAHSCLVSSVMEYISPAISEILKEATQGVFPSGNFYGSSGLAPYHDFEATISNSIKDKVDQISTSLRSGVISTGYNPVR
jgi:basic membrane protein A